MKKSSFLLCLFTMITIGCGNANSGAAHAGNHGGIIAGQVVPSLSIQQNDHDMTFIFSLKNQTEHVVKYTFGTTQRYDYIIKDSDGNVVQQFSKGRMFGQMVGYMTLKQSEEHTFKAVVHDLPAGDYTITFWLTDQKEQPKVKKSFTVH